MYLVAPAVRPEPSSEVQRTVRTLSPSYCNRIRRGSYSCLSSRVGPPHPGSLPSPLKVHPSDLLLHPSSTCPSQSFLLLLEFLVYTWSFVRGCDGTRPGRRVDWSRDIPCLCVPVCPLDIPRYLRFFVPVGPTEGLFPGVLTLTSSSLKRFLLFFSLLPCNLLERISVINVGIGTTSPAVPQHVGPQTYGPGVTVKEGSGTSRGGHPGK